MQSVSLRLTFVELLLALTSLAQNPTPRPDRAADSPPERVCLSEIVISAPESGTQAQMTEAKNKAEKLHDAIRLGRAFPDLAKGSSEGPTAKSGGGIGCFKRGLLAKSFDELVFRMKIGDVSDVLKTKLGFVILQVTGQEPEPSSRSWPRTVPEGLASGVKGTVVDQSGGAISDAYVLTHSEDGPNVNVRTDTSGRYTIPLPTGIYDVFVSADGFSPTSRKIEVTPDGMMILNATLASNRLGWEIN